MVWGRGLEAVIKIAAASQSQLIRFRVSHSEQENWSGRPGTASEDSTVTLPPSASSPSIKLPKVCWFSVQ